MLALDKSAQFTQDQLWLKLEGWAMLGRSADNAVERQALSQADFAARDALLTWAADWDLASWSDPAGNIFVCYPGQDPALAPIYAGSHLDTQPMGGRFDGVLGVAAVQQVMEAWKTHGWQGKRSLVLASWSNEEGCRFTPACTGSRYFVGSLTESELDDICSPEGESFAKLVRRWRKVESVTCRNDSPLPAAYLELHIEQDTHLEVAGADVGLVHSMQGCAWLEVTIKGISSHAGTQSLADRHDALYETCLAIGGLRQLYYSYGADARITVGRLQVFPNTANTIPGKTRFTVDLRHPEAAKLNQMLLDARDIIVDALPRCRAECRTISRIAQVDFSSSLIGILAQAADALGYQTLSLRSGAFHDAGPLSQICPAAMLFAPSRGGYSHCAEEYTSPEQCFAAACVLEAALRELTQQVSLST